MALPNGVLHFVLLNYGMTKRPTKRPGPAFKRRARRKHFFKAWRKYRKMTLEYAAEKAGMSAGNISAMERGAQGYTQDGLESLADVYGVPSGWLIDLDPFSASDIISIWERAKPSDRKKIVDIAETIVGKPGTV